MKVNTALNDYMKKNKINPKMLALGTGHDVESVKLASVGKTSTVPVGVFWTLVRAGYSPEDISKGQKELYSMMSKASAVEKPKSLKEINMSKDDRLDIPILESRISERGTKAGCLVVNCPYCGDTHFHYGTVSGVRLSGCRDGANRPYFINVERA